MTKQDEINNRLEVFNLVGYLLPNYTKLTGMLKFGVVWQY